MLHTTNKETSEQFTTYTDVLKQNNSDSSEADKTSYEPIENTPFFMVGSEKKGYFIALGNHRMTEPKPTKEEAREELEIKKWNIIANLFIVMDEAKKQYDNLLNTKEIA